MRRSRSDYDEEGNRQADTSRGILVSGVVTGSDQVKTYDLDLLGNLADTQAVLLGDADLD